MNKKMILSSLGTFVVGILVGGALLYNDDVYSAVKKTITGEDLQNTVGAITTADLQTMDIVSAMAAVQSQRAKLLEDQLKSQISAVQSNNEKVAKLNYVLAGLYQVKGRFGASAPANAAVTSKEQSDLSQLYSAAGLKEIPKTKSEVDAHISSVKQSIDALSNSQQMEMLRLQSLSNKRNEAFDVMTNFVKKMQDSRSSIIGNMR
ncbi:hypothetical protein [Cohnella herbarum]|uniref:Uncharacterized protein n=1 Tax=Cohnella herbarum TaxID=2728023 RepID=A0A7Z2VF17_9BACL|nr:hypothetical protein [Cohnella herbarum]QJD81719.1 hypothetical protein HH215_16795 [Cohnella herbarum]